MSKTSVLTPLAEALDPDRYGGKAAQLAAALAHGLPVPAGFALDWEAARDAASGAAPLLDVELTTGVWAVRSSAIGEDSAAASFAGAHLTVLGCIGGGAVLDAVRRVHASGQDASAQSYRARLGVEQEARMAVVIQAMVRAEVAGVMFTRNPVTHAPERVIEASWGLGESVVSGAVTPDQWRLDADGELLEHVPGEKDRALRLRSDGSVEEVVVEGDEVRAPCLSWDDLASLHRLALLCDQAYGAQDHDIEFAVEGGRLHLLQRRPITRG